MGKGVRDVFGGGTEYSYSDSGEVEVEQMGQPDHPETPDETVQPENDATNTEDADNNDATESSSKQLKVGHVSGSDYVFRGNF